MDEARALAVLGSVAALAVAATFLFLPPIPQSASYHEFADRSALLGIPHSLDVLSNFGFLIVGAWGLAFVGGESNSQERRPFLSALERWVEQGVAPERIVAVKYVNNQPAKGIQRTRPLCAYPKTAVYKGTGSTDDAANFECRQPKPSPSFNKDERERDKHDRDEDDD